MADQKRWFKVWVSILDDPHFQELPLEDIGRWALLGALTAFVGTRGRLRTPPTARRLRETLRVNGSTPLKLVLERLPSVLFEEGKNRDADCCVTWKNWLKYQRDATASERMKRLRSKRRGEEKRGEERKMTPLKPPPSVFKIPASVEEALNKLAVLGQVRRLRDPAWWQSHVRAYGQVDFAKELLKAEAWVVTKGPARYRDKARFMHNWIVRAAADYQEPEE